MQKSLSLLVTFCCALMLMVPPAFTAQLVETTDIADGAVTDAKITGPISSAKIESEGLNADMVDGKHASDLAPAVHGHWITDVSGLDAQLAGKATISHNHDGVYATSGHNHDAEYQNRYPNVIVVAENGGDFTDLASALNSIVDASEQNPYLIKLMPGTYQTGYLGIQMKEYVDILGSGRNVTKIKGSVVNGYSLITAASHAALRDVTIENSELGYSTKVIECKNISCEISDIDVVSTGSSIGINLDNAEADIHNVKISMDGGANNYGYKGISVYNSNVAIKDIDIVVEGGTSVDTGVHVNTVSFDKVLIDDAKILVSGGVNSYGVAVYGGTVVVKNSDIDTSTDYIYPMSKGAMIQGSGSLMISGSKIRSTDSGVSVMAPTEIVNSDIHGGNNSVSISNVSTTSKAMIANTKVTHGIVNYAELKCVGVYDSNFEPVVCQ